ncbi:MAG: TIGR01777 family oxidoreductase [Flavobacteriales bacterium]
MKVIITGGSGLVGTRITQLLLERGDEVINLTTQKDLTSNMKGLTHVYWNPSKSILDKLSIEGADAAINLAGYNVSNRWTSDNKKKIVESRLESTQLLVQTMRSLDVAPRILVSTSASGYYPSSQMQQEENATAGSGFLSELSQKWEQSAEQIGSKSKLCILRVSVVLSKKGGALAKLLPLFKWGLGSALGTGRQMMSWIHIDDLAKMYIHCIDQQLNGIYNACSPAPVTNYTFSKSLATALKKPFFLPAVPAFVLKLVLGEMSSMLLESQNLSSQKIVGTGFRFEYFNIDQAFSQIAN